MRRERGTGRRVLMAALTSTVLVVGSGASGVGASPAPTGLTGESLQSQPFLGGQMTVQSSCGSNNNGTVGFRAFGMAGGTFPGMFYESGVLVMGPAPSPAEFLESPVVSFSAAFVILSPGATVQGVASLGTSSTTGTCQRAFSSGIIYSGTYQAVITPTGGTPYLDTGVTTFAYTSATDSSMSESFQSSR